MATTKAKDPFAHLKLIAITDLLLDVENPRQPLNNVGQHEALVTLVKRMGKKMLTIAEDVAATSIDPSNLPIVLPTSDHKGRYIVLEGNRRIAAIKILTTPDILNEVLSGSQLDRYRVASRLFKERGGLDQIICHVVESRAEARHWMELRHGGEMGGAGTVRWNHPERERWQNSGKKLHIQVLDWLEKKGHSKETKKPGFKVTNLERLFTTPAAREALGVKLADGELAFTEDDKYVTKALLATINKMSQPKFTVRDVDSATLRKQFAEQIAKENGHPALSKKGAAGATPTAKKTSGTARKTARGLVRESLIPETCKLNVTKQKCKYLEGELRDLHVGEYPNITSAGFRVFLELSCDAYIETARIKIPKQDWAPLDEKVKAVLDDLLSKGRLKKPYHSRLKQICNSPNISNLHSFLHRLDAFPASGDLLTYWDNVQPLFEAMWPET